MGMLCAIALGKRLGRDYAVAPRVEQLRARTHALLASVPDKARRLAGITAQQCFELCGSDKKHEKNNFFFIAITAQGQVEQPRLPKTAGNSALLTAADDVLAEYRT